MIWAPPTLNQGNWRPGIDIGITGGIKQYLQGGINDRAVTGTVVDMTAAPYNCDPDGIIPVDSAVQDAINAASGPTVLDFGTTGTFLFSSGFIYSNYKPNISFRGYGTTFRCSVTTASNIPIFIHSGPGAFDSNEQVVTGTKTKGTATLSIPDTTGYVVGCFIEVGFENETDDARIIAGSIIGWASKGYRRVRRYMAKVTAVVANTSITIDPPLVGDATNLELVVHTKPTTQKNVGWIFEGMAVSFDPANHPFAFVSSNTAEECGFYAVDFLNWSKNGSNGNCIDFTNTYKCEVRKCKFRFETGATSDGAIQSTQNTSLLVIDNVGYGVFDSFFYDNENSVNTALAYNCVPEGYFSYLHNAHPSLILREGNYCQIDQDDGFHGSSSNNTHFRVFYRAGFAVNRFKRQSCISGCIIGVEGAVTGSISWGNPNIGNGDAIGFAGPTGLSDQVGQIDFSQPGYGNGGGSYNTYVIQPEDIFVGDFWGDWKSTGTLDVRTSDLIGTFTFNSGRFQAGIGILLAVWWEGGVILDGDITDVTGDQVTVTFPTGSLPPVDTEVEFFFGAVGFQERDLDVQASSTLAQNFMARADGTGAIAPGSIGTDTLPISLMFDETPEFFLEEDLELPAFDVEDPSTWSPLRIPAGIRYYDGLPPAAPEFEVNPSIAGTMIIGETITIARGSASGNPPPTLTSQLVRCDAEGDEIEDIAGATGLTYVIQPEDNGCTFRVRVTAGNGVGSDAVATSEPTDVVTPFMGDAEIINQTVNALPVSELWVINGVPVLHEHSGNYPQLDGTGTQNTATTYTLPNVGEIAFHGGDNKQVYGWLTSQLVGANNAARLAYALSIRP